MMRGGMRVAAALAFARVHMDGRIHQRRHGVEQFVADVFGDPMAFAGRHLAIHDDVELSPLTMSHPANGYIMDVHDFFR